LLASFYASRKFSTYGLAAIFQEVKDDCDYSKALLEIIMTPVSKIIVTGVILQYGVSQSADLRSKKRISILKNNSHLITVLLGVL